MKVVEVSFAVKKENYEEAKEYFQKLTGISPREEILPYPKLKVAIFEGETVLKVVTPADKGSHIDRFLERTGGGVVSISLGGVEVTRYDVPTSDGGFLAPTFLGGTLLKIVK
ncbi:MAG: hypothetical protein GXO39_03145 [Thermotogae bacterium]|nr:hypothetical protein [Thermotogota bacterium]